MCTESSVPAPPRTASVLPRLSWHHDAARDPAFRPLRRADMDPLSPADCASPQHLQPVAVPERGYLPTRDWLRAHYPALCTRMGNHYPLRWILLSRVLFRRWHRVWLGERRRGGGGSRGKSRRQSRWGRGDLADGRRQRRIGQPLSGLGCAWHLCPCAWAKRVRHEQGSQKQGNRQCDQQNELAHSTRTCARRATSSGHRGLEAFT